MAVLVGKAPLFTSKAVINGGEIVNDFSLDKFLGKKQLFFSLSRLYICLSTNICISRKIEEFKSRNVNIACSTDSEQSHWGWLQVEKENGGTKGVTYPILADIDKTISTIMMLYLETMK